MRDALADIKGRDETPAPNSQPAPGLDSKAETPATPEEPTGKVRGADGKFIAKEAAPKTAPEAKPDQAAQGVGEGVKDQSQAKAPAVVSSSAPSSWAPDAKAAYDALPPVVKSQIHKREQDISRQVQQSAEKLKQYEAIGKHIEPQKDFFVKSYGSVERGIADLMAINDVAVKNPVGFVQWFIQSRGLKPEQVFNQTGQTQQQPQGQQATPQIAALSSKVSALENTLTQQQDAQAIKLLQDFAATHPHFDDLREEIAAFMERGLDLEASYEKAKWADPAVREQLLAEQQQSLTTTQQKEAEARAKTARRGATVAAVTRGGAGASPAVPTSMEDDMRATLARIKGAA